MRKFQIISWATFATGMIFKSLHFPGGSILLLLGTIMLLIHGIIYLAKNSKTNLSASLLHLSVSLLIFCGAYKIMHFPGAIIFYILALIVSLGTVFGVVLLFRKKS